DDAGVLCCGGLESKLLYQRFHLLIEFAIRVGEGLASDIQVLFYQCLARLKFLFEKVITCGFGFIQEVRMRMSVVANLNIISGCLSELIPVHVVIPSYSFGVDK